MHPDANFSLSTRDGHNAGKILFAQSSSLNKSDVAASASKAAFRPCTKGSLNDRPKAFIRTFCLVCLYVLASTLWRELLMIHAFAPRLRAIFPKQTVVLVRMPGCSSLDVFARHFSISPLITRSESLEMIVRVAFTVCSRTTGATSVKPVA